MLKFLPLQNPAYKKLICSDQAKQFLIKRIEFEKQADKFLIKMSFLYKRIKIAGSVKEKIDNL